MLYRFLFFLGTLLTVIASGCKDDPGYPDNPIIKYNRVDRDLIYDDFAMTYDDSVTFHIDFTDGDGDLGIEKDDNARAYTLATDDQGQHVHYDADDPSLPPYSCTRYIIQENNSGSGSVSFDTLLINPDPNYYNFFVEVFEKQADGTYEQVDLSNICPSFNGRFNDLTPDGYEGPLEGTLRYSPPGNPWKLFEGKTIKCRIQIRDNNNHFSNKVDTEPITFTY